MSLPDALRSLRHRNYRLFFAGQLVSLPGTWMQSVAQAGLAYSLTRSGAGLGIVGFAGQIPALLFSPAGGVVADRFARRRVLLATQATSMVLAFTLAFQRAGAMRRERKSAIVVRPASGFSSMTARRWRTISS